ncbi:MAG: CNNM domain-containing protein, partial [Candidatus Tectimicrobiota bacterium]
VTLLIGNELVNVSTSILVAAVALSLFGPIGKLYAIVISTLLLLLFGEVAPKTYAVHRPEPHARFVARPLMAFQWLITPVRVVLVKLVDRITTAAGSETSARKTYLTEEEFKTLVEVGHTEGVLEAEEKDLIQSVVAFGDTRVRDIMTPRTDMACIAEEATFEDVLTLIRQSVFSRLPVYRDGLDHIVGILYVKTSSRPFEATGTGGAFATCSGRHTLCPKRSSSAKCSRSSRPRSSTWRSWPTNTAGWRGL